MWAVPVRIFSRRSERDIFSMILGGGGRKGLMGAAFPGAHPEVRRRRHRIKIEVEKLGR